MSRRPDPSGDMLRRIAEFSAEVHLRRMKVQPALRKLDRYLDSATLAGALRVKVIHGRSGGSMKAAVHRFLESHPLVETYYAAAPAEGGPGVTIAELK